MNDTELKGAAGLCALYGVNEWFAALCARCRWQMFVKQGQGAHDCLCPCHVRTEGWSKPTGKPAETAKQGKSLFESAIKLINNK